MMKNTRISRTFLIAKIVCFILFFLYSLTIVYPFVWAFLASLKDLFEYQSDNFGFPLDFWGGFVNYKRAWQILSAGGMSMPKMLWNSIWFTLGSAFLTVATSVCTAYVAAKYEFPGAKWLGIISLAVMLIPVYGNLSATYILYFDLKIYDSPLLLISYTSAFGFNFILLYSYFKSIPWSYAESAFLDGASNFRAFLTIMVPLAASPIAALFVMSCVGMWNDYMVPILFLPSYYTIPAGLYIYQIESERMLDYPMLFAGVLMSILPILLLFVIMQDKLMDLTLSGGIKG